MIRISLKIEVLVFFDKDVIFDKVDCDYYFEVILDDEDHYLI